VDDDDAPWMDHRDELLDRVVRSGRSRKRRRGLSAVGALVVVALAVAGGLVLPGGGGRKLQVTNPDGQSTTTTSRAAPAPPVLLIGDSIMLGAATALQRDVPGAHVDAAVSRQLQHAIAILDADKSSGLLPATVVIHLGDNGPSGTDAFDQAEADVDKIVQAAGPRSTVYFLTLKLPRAWQDEVNSAFTTSAPRWPNAHVLDWRSFSESHADWFTLDGFHLNPTGQVAYAAFIRDGLRAPVTTYTDPFAGGAIPASGFVAADDAKSLGPQGPTTFTQKLVGSDGRDLGPLPGGPISNDALNAPRHVLVVTDTGMRLEPLPPDTTIRAPQGCAVTQKVATLAVALCGSGTGINLLGDRVLVNRGSGWMQLIAKPPVTAGDPLVGHWAWAAPSADGRWVLADWLAECEVPLGLFVNVADGSVKAVTGEKGTAWRGAPESGTLGWATDGSAMVVFGGSTECGTSAPVRRGVYLVSPDTGSRRLLVPLSATEQVLPWSAVRDERTALKSSR
jgi:hypothetical protein